MMAEDIERDRYHKHVSVTDDARADLAADGATGVATGSARGAAGGSPASDPDDDDAPISRVSKSPPIRGDDLSFDDAVVEGESADPQPGEG